MKKLSAVFAILFLLCAFRVSAEGDKARQLTLSGLDKKLTDSSYLTSADCGEIKISADGEISSLYIIFHSKAQEFKVKSGEKTKTVKTDFLHTLTDVSELKSNELTVDFGGAKISDIYAFSAGTLPDFVQNWEKPLQRADILLNSSHSDDDQLFFAGLLPYYAARGCDIQVVYYTDHKNEPRRRHELLNGLWTVGIKYYPVINNFPDYYSESLEGALKTIATEGFTENDALGVQVELLRRFKPQVVVSHDFKGEYGHGMHILNAAMLKKAVEISGDDKSFPETAEKYGVYTPKKLYVHLYNENKIVMDYDLPSEFFGGKTPFEMSKLGFLEHKSQQGTWFKKWMFGKNGEITKASQIKKYSPCEYGLYFTSVGADVQKNDMLENITLYSEQERIKAEEEAEKQRLEEKKRAEEKAKAEAERKVQKAKKRKIIIAAAVTPIALFVIFIIAINIAARCKAAKRRKMRGKR